MRRTAMPLILCTALATPMVAHPGDQAIPSEAQWTATPPMRSTGDGNQLASVLVDPAMITPPESPALMPSQAAAPVPPSRVKAWTWDEIDHTRVRSSAGD